MSKKIISYFLSLNRTSKQLLQIITDIILIIFCFSLSYILRLELFSIINFYSTALIYSIGVIIPITIYIFYILGVYNNLIRHLGSKSSVSIAIGAIFSGILIYLSNYLFTLGIPRSVPFIYILLLIISSYGIRIFIKQILFEQKINYSNILIYGAGNAGRKLLDSIKNDINFHPAGFIDDSNELEGKYINNLKIYNSRNIKAVIKKKQITKIFIAIPSASKEERKKIIATLEKLNVECQTVPDLNKIITGEEKFDQLTPINLEDLLGRDTVKPKKELLEKNVREKNVMITGAGGSIGGQLASEIIKLGPNKIILYDISEYALYKIEKLILSNDNNVSEYLPEIKTVLGSVQNTKRLKNTINQYDVHTIYHAAAYKHVPLLEANIIEAVRNNIFGTKIIAEIAIQNKVESFNLISTDKAVRPTNIMGATKRMAELICQSIFSKEIGSKLSIVRFGNVIGSSGSVIPLFVEQINRGGPVTITDSEVTRFFMSMKEAALLVIQASAMSNRNSIYVLDMGEPIKILDVAIKMIRLKGLKYYIGRKNSEKNNHVQILFTGLRPGEKLHEELFITKEIEKTEHPRINCANEESIVYSELENILLSLDIACDDFNIERIIDILKNAPLEFYPKI